MSVRLSNSSMDIYNLCPAKYKFRYIDGWKTDKTFTSLLFGSAIDASLNYILRCLQKKRIYNVSTAKWLFCRYMDKWYGQNELMFFKKEVPEDLQDCQDKLIVQWGVFYKLVDLGQQIIDTYITEILT